MDYDKAMSCCKARRSGHLVGMHPGQLAIDSLVVSAELPHSLKVSDRRHNTPKSALNRSESLCSSLWAPCRIFWGPNPARNRRFPAGSLIKSFRGPLSSALWCDMFSRAIGLCQKMLLVRAATFLSYDHDGRGSCLPLCTVLMGPWKML